MTADRAEQLLAALIAEAAFGYPAALFAAIGHPVTWAGALIAVLDTRWNTGTPHRQRLAGIALLAVLTAAAGTAGWAITRLAGNGWGLVALILVAATGLAQRSLHTHVAAVLTPLKIHDLAAARVAVAAIVGRDTAGLGEAGIAAAAIESLAESFCDGVIAPAFWFLVAGLPGLLICKAINTADSMVGHRDDRHRHFGWASARADDLVMLIPARISGLLICLAAATSHGRRTVTSPPRASRAQSRDVLPVVPGPAPNPLATMLKYAPAHASPNSGWPEAAMAGALGIRLGGPVTYAGDPTPRAILGSGPAPATADLADALALYRRACLLLWLVTAGLAWRL